MKTIAENDPRLVFLPFDQVTNPPNGLCIHYKDRWWIVHPVKGLVFWVPAHTRKSFQHPQCNAQEFVARELMGKMYPWAETRLIPQVLVPSNPRDWRE